MGVMNIGETGLAVSGIERKIRKAAKDQASRDDRLNSIAIEQNATLVRIEALLTRLLEVSKTPPLFEVRHVDAAGAAEASTALREAELKFEALLAVVDKLNHLGSGSARADIVAQDLRDILNNGGNSS